MSFWRGYSSSHTLIADRFDAVIHIDRTTALQPLVPNSTGAATLFLAAQD